MIAVRTAISPDGGLVHTVDAPASRLPGVQKRDIEQAWEAAQAVPAAAPRSFVFPNGDAPLVLHLADADAASWAEAVAETIGIATARGVSICLRLLGLVALMVRADWVRPYFRATRGGTELKPALLLAAAQAPLTDAGGFDEAAFRALLPPA